MQKMKKCLSLLLLCCLLLGILPSAQAASNASLELDTSKKGSEYTVTVKLTGNKRPNMIEFCLEYSSSKLKLKSVSAGSAFSSGNAPTYSTPKAGRVLFAWESLPGLKDGKLLVLTFTSKSGATGSADVYFNEDFDTVFMDEDMDDITVTLRRASIDLGERKSSYDDDDDYDDDDYEPYVPYKPKTPQPTAEAYEPYVPYEWDDEPDDPVDEPFPWELEPEETPIPLNEVETPEYAMADMVIYVDQVCSTQEGFLFLSSDSGVVVIENGQLRGVSPGIATVTAYKDGAAIGSCTITVQADPAKQVKPASSGVNILSVVLWGGIALILIAVILIVIILIRRRRY